MRRLAAIVAGAALTVGIAGSSGMAAQVTVVQLELVDTTRPTAATTGVPAATSRSLPTTVYLPPTTAPAPLIVLAHGASGAPEKFTDLATYWAEHGYVVAVPRFPLTNDQVPQPVLGDFASRVATCAS